MVGDAGRMKQSACARGHGAGGRARISACSLVMRLVRWARPLCISNKQFVGLEPLGWARPLCISNKQFVGLSNAMGPLCVLIASAMSRFSLGLVLRKAKNSTKNGRFHARVCCENE